MIRRASCRLSAMRRPTVKRHGPRRVNGSTPLAGPCHPGVILARGGGVEDGSGAPAVLRRPAGGRASRRAARGGGPGHGIAHGDAVRRRCHAGLREAQQARRRRSAAQHRPAPGRSRRRAGGSDHVPLVGERPRPPRGRSRHRPGGPVGRRRGALRRVRRRLRADARETSLLHEVVDPLGRAHLRHPAEDAVQALPRRRLARRRPGGDGSAEARSRLGEARLRLPSSPTAPTASATAVGSRRTSIRSSAPR